MKVIIYGAGDIGYSIASYLAAEENDVAVIDESADRIAYVTETLDVQGLRGKGSFPDVLEKANARKADLFIAVTPVDEFNIIACQVAYSVFKVPTKIAHIRSPHYLDPAWRHIYTSDHVPVDFIISPEQEVAQSILNTFHVSGATSVVPLHHHGLKVIGLYCHFKCPLLGQRLEELSERCGVPFRILCFVREGSAIIPDAEDVLKIHDEVYLLVESRVLSRVMGFFGHGESLLETVVILGAGRVGCSLAEKIATIYPDLNVKIIEKDEAQAHYAAQTLEKAVVIHGDALDDQFLRESNVSSADRVICVTNNDEVNVLSAFLSKNLKAKHVTTLINNRTYPTFLPSLGVDSIVTPSSTTMSYILRRIYQDSVQSLTVLQGGFGSIFEYLLEKDSPLIGEKFRIFNIPRHCALGGIIRDQEFLIPQAQEFIQSGDLVVLLVMKDSLSLVDTFLKGGDL